MRWAARHPDWALGFQDETWWRRLAQPALRTWTKPDRLLSAAELAERVCAYFDCPYEEHLSIPEHVA
jgi:hypothetical protein